MNDPEDKIIGGNSSNISGSEKIIGGNPSDKSGSEKVLTGDDKTKTFSGEKATQAGASPPEEKNIETLLHNATKNGGLKELPADFENKDGSWSSILSENPFENLYLDYQLYAIISDEMVQTNYEILNKFWKEKFLSLNGVAREKIKIRYGEAVVNGAQKKLDLAFQRLKTFDGRLLYFQERNKKRLQNGIASIKELLEMAISEGSLAERSARSLINKGIEKGLLRNEVVDYILEVLNQNYFKPRAPEISLDPFKNQWMTDEAHAEFKKRSVPVVEWLNEKADSMEKLGEITFRKKAESEYFLKNANFLPPLVAKLTDSASRTAEFQRIIEEESDVDKRYLRIVYHLDAALPFRFRGGIFNDISQLLTNACETADSFWALVDLYTKNYLHIWLEESAPEVAALLPENRNLVGFLTFLYAINRNYPFYLNKNKFTSPEDLVRQAKINQSIWVSISQSMQNGHLPTWFASIGRSDINQKYNKNLGTIIETGLYQDGELNLIAAQTLMLAIDSLAPAPIVSADISEINLLEIEGGSMAVAPIKLKLLNAAFVKAEVKLDTDIAGITLSSNEITFNSYENKVEIELAVIIDSSQLVKDKLYSLNFQMITAYGKTEIPIQIKVVFPKKAYTIKLVQYGLIGALYFGIFRYVLGLLLGYDGWLSQYPYLISESPLLSFIVFALFIGGGIYSYKLVRKIEKI